MAHPIPPNFVNLVRNVIPVPNFLWRMAANPCSIRPYVFAETMLPAALFLFSRLVIFDLNDLIVDNSRRAAHNIAGGSRRKTRIGPKAMGARQKPNRVMKATRFLFFPINLVERAGFAYLLVNFVDDLSISWSTILSQCPKCVDTGDSIALGPLLREWIPGDQTIGTGFAGIPMETLLQNRAGWVSTLQSVTLPQGRWNIIASGTVERVFGIDIGMEARLRVDRTIGGFPITTIDDEVKWRIPATGSGDFILSTTISVPPASTAIVGWQWRTTNTGINIIKRVNGEAIVTGQSTCAS